MSIELTYQGLAELELALHFAVVVFVIAGLAAQAIGDQRGRRRKRLLGESLDRAPWRAWTNASPDDLLTAYCLNASMA